jgi:hypothetical protein
MDRNVDGFEKPQQTVSFTVTGMPDTVFADWKKTCIGEYGNCYWVKIMSDHLTARQFENFVEMYSQVLKANMSLEERIINLEKHIVDMENKISNAREPKVTLG